MGTERIQSTMTADVKSIVGRAGKPSIPLPPPLPPSPVSSILLHPPLSTPLPGGLPPSHSHFAPHPVINPDLAVTKVTGAAAQKEEVAPPAPAAPANPLCLF